MKPVPINRIIKYYLNFLLLFFPILGLAQYFIGFTAWDVPETMHPITCVGFLCTFIMINTTKRIRAYAGGVLIGIILAATVRVVYGFTGPSIMALAGFILFAVSGPKCRPIMGLSILALSGLALILFSFDIEILDRTAMNLHTIILFFHLGLWLKR